MKWTYSVRNKIFASALLFSLCLLVLFSNYLDRVHTNKVKKSIATLYEDRLIAEGYILKMTSIIYQIREELQADMDQRMKAENLRSLNHEFYELYNAYMKTKLTETESVTATALLDYFKKIEQNISDNHYFYTNKSLLLLIQLSSIQLEESKLIMQQAESEYATIKSSSQFAFIIIIIILVVLQVLVFSSKTIFPLSKPKDHMLN
ncbi:MAG: MCP four helix bundle domain-containing protein [Candidatus Competibacteraceae bacterium]|nr:MCP four helix bundle domain-containing protein [Candidatus Competibacteraceae bacterium]